VEHVEVAVAPHTDGDIDAKVGARYVNTVDVTLWPPTVTTIAGFAPCPGGTKHVMTVWAKPWPVVVHVDPPMVTVPVVPKF